MYNKYIEEIFKAGSAPEYETAIEKLIDCLITQGKADEADELRNVAALRTNLFSSRSGVDDLSIKKVTVQSFMKLMTNDESRSNTKNIVFTVLKNFPEYCRKLYMTKIHDKCSSGIKEHLDGFHIENEYDLQKTDVTVIDSHLP